jgi:hypothetical protein
VNLYDALLGLEGKDGMGSAPREAVAANPIASDGEISLELDSGQLESEAGVEVVLLRRRLALALRNQYGPALSERDHRLILAGASLATMVVKRWTNIDGGPRWFDESED